MKPSPFKWIPWALVALPVGLMVGLGIAMWMYFEKKEDEATRVHGHARALQREPGAADLERHIRILREAEATAPEVRLETLRSYLESTLGPSNMGYEIIADHFDAGGADRMNVAVELKGTKSPLDVVIVLASYGAPPSASENEQLAAFLALAQAVTGSPQVRSIRFLVVDASPGTDDPKARLSRALDQSLANGRRAADVLKIEELLADPTGKSSLLDRTTHALENLRLLAGRL